MFVESCREKETCFFCDMLDLLLLESKANFKPLLHVRTRIKAIDRMYGIFFYKSVVEMSVPAAAILDQKSSASQILFVVVPTHTFSEISSNIF